MDAVLSAAVILVLVIRAVIVEATTCTAERVHITATAWIKCWWSLVSHPIWIAAEIVVIARIAWIEILSIVRVTVQVYQTIERVDIFGKLIQIKVIVEIAVRIPIATTTAAATVHRVKRTIAKIAIVWWDSILHEIVTVRSTIWNVPIHRFLNF